LAGELQSWESRVSEKECSEQKGGKTEIRRIPRCEKRDGTPLWTIIFRMTCSVGTTWGRKGLVLEKNPKKKEGGKG